MKNRPGTIRSILVLAFAVAVVYNQYTAAERVDELEARVNDIHTGVIIDRLERELNQPEQPRFFTPSKRAAEFRIVKTNRQIFYTDRDEFCLAKNIFHEAGVEDIIGKYAVAQVTLNRVKNSRYPDSICDVVLQHRQFSWANDHSIRWTTPRGPLWEESRVVARAVLEGGHRLQGLETANYYHADYVSPRWASNEYKIAQLGTHVFYSGTPR